MRCMKKASYKTTKTASRPTGGGCCGLSTDAAEATRQAVQKRYADLIKSPPGVSCCGTDAKVADMAGYTNEQLRSVPEELRGTSFGCGNPLAFAGVEEGQVVLDIGSGAGLDALLAARKVGPGGRVIGLDMTPEMIETARNNADKAGAANVEFRLGDAEDMPVDSGLCDWIVSNCVINLAPDKGRVFAEAFRVLKPGGRMMISDIVAHGLAPEVRRSVEAWTGCIAGALEEEEYLRAIRAAGFEDVEVVDKLTYDEDSIRAMTGGSMAEPMDESLSGIWELATKITGRISSIRISAVKPSH